MQNARLTVLQTFIGKPFAASPSPYAHWLNGTVVSATENSVVFAFTVRKEMTNPAGMLHGGVTAGMIDDCMGVTFFILGLDYFYPTISLNIDFFAPANEGETVLVSTQVVKQGKTVINIKADMHSQHAKLLATATANLAISNIKIGF